MGVCVLTLKISAFVLGMLSGAGSLVTAYLFSKRHMHKCNVAAKVFTGHVRFALLDYRLDVWIFSTVECHSMYGISGVFSSMAIVSRPILLAVLLKGIVPRSAKALCSMLVCRRAIPWAAKAGGIHLGLVWPMTVRASFLRWVYNAMSDVDRR